MDGSMTFGSFDIGPFEQSSHQAARAAFRWPQPDRYNIAEAACARWARAEPDRIALHHLGEDDAVETWTFGRLDREACRLANVLRAHGVDRGARVGILLPQRPEAALAHFACYKIGAIALPLFTLFGEDALAYRLGDAGADVVLVDRANSPKLVAARSAASAPRRVFCVDGAADGALDLWSLMAQARDAIAPVETGPDDPSFLCYTSGTTGPAKGALHGHRALIGHLPGVQMFLEGVPKPGDVAWTPADWAWLGGLCDMLLPCLNYGVPVVAHRMAKFDPERALWIYRRFGVTISFMPPTALKMMRSADLAIDPSSLKLRAVGCGGEPLGVELLDWGRETLGLTINEFYGQTECNLVAANNAALAPVKPGSIGPATPGFALTVIDADGADLPRGETGELAVRRDNLSMFLGYWGREEATAVKFVAREDGEWLRTGDEARMDEDGYAYFSSRADDIINSAGYRIGPSEIEDCLSGHPAVAVAGVVGVPDELRGEAVKAYVTLRRGVVGDDALVVELREHVRARLSPHVAPRDVAFLDALPMTATGKIMRRDLKRRHAEMKE